MARNNGNRAWMSTATTGTGTITLGSALSGYQSFSAAGIANGDTVRYTIIDGANWEIGIGTYTSSGTTLSRTPSESSNGGAAINLSGNATVFITGAAEDLADLNIPQTWEAVQGYDETALTWGASSTTSWDVSAAPVATLTASDGNTTMSAPTNVTAGRFYKWRFEQGATPRTVSWDATAYKFANDQAPTMPTVNGAFFHLTFYGRASNILEEVGRSEGVT